MKRSEQLGQLAAALSAAQIEMTAAQMDGNNPHFRSKYATLASVIDAIRPIHKQGLALLQTATVARSDAGVSVEIETMLAHKSGEWVSESISLKPQADNPQSVGSAITYGRRYLAAAICGIAADDDDDGNEATKPTPKPARKPDPKQVEKQEAPADAPPVSTPANSAADVASKIKRARSLLASKGVKTVEHFKLAIKGVLGKDVEGMTDLSGQELDVLIADLEREAA